VARAASRLTSSATILPAHGSDALNATASLCDVNRTSIVPSMISAFGAKSAAALFIVRGGKIIAWQRVAVPKPKKPKGPTA